MSASAKPSKTAAFDRRLRLHVYRQTVRSGRVPTSGDLAKSLRQPVEAVREGLHRLAEAHALVLSGDGEVWRAAPFCAVPTGFLVRSGRTSWWGTCAWDALGIPAMLRRDADIDSACACCNERIVLRVRRGRVAPEQAVIHFAVPARNWYDDIAFT